MVNNIGFKRKAKRLSLFEEQLMRCLYECDRPASADRLMTLMPALFHAAPDEHAINKGLASLCARGLISICPETAACRPLLPEDEFSRLIRKADSPGLSSLWIE